MRVQYEDLVKEFTRVLVKNGLSAELAQESATIFADNSADGVYSHGVNRFPRVVSYIQKGYIDPDGKPAKIDGIGGIERWNGNGGMGNTNAKICMNRAIGLAKEYGIGCVAVRNTNHWMRGGTYGWQAAEKGCIGICWTNTQPNMPAWGAKDSRLGNNPFIMAIPRSNGEHVVVDSAMAQFSYGKIEETQMNGKQLPLPGGYDSEGNLTTDPDEILKTRRVLPIGYWKGAGMSIAFDLLATILSGGNSVADIGRQGDDEYGISQVFIAIDPRHFYTSDETDKMIDKVLEDIKASTPVSPGNAVRYPGEGTMARRRDNLEKGIPVQESIWNKIKSL